MRVSIATLAFAAYLGLVSADSCTQQPKGYDPTPGILSISSPDTTHPVTAGSDATITWSKLASTASKVSIVLCKGPSTNCVPIECIVNGADNNAQSYTWKVPTSLSASGSSGGYGLKIIEDGTGNFQYSTQFGVLNSNPVSSSASPVQQISDGQVQAPTGTVTATSINAAATATSTKPLYTVPGTAGTGKLPVASTGLYYVAPPIGKASNTTHSSGFKFSYGPNTFPAAYNSTAFVSSTGAVTVPSSVPAVTQTAIASGGAGGVGGAPPAATGSATQSPITAAIGAAPRMAAGGVLAGLGALAALVL